MIQERPISFEIASRLKKLREEKNLSHNKLRDALYDQLGISISADSLMNYEVACEHRSGAYKNLGMKVEYLLAFSAFYGVSTDYLLGLTDVRTPVSETQAIIKQTGLSEENALLLEGLQDMGAQAHLSFINDLIAFSTGGEMLLHFLLMKSTLSIPQPVAWNDIDFDNLSFDQLPLITGSTRQYGYIHFTGKDAFEYHCSRIAKELENALLRKYTSSAKWRDQDGND